MKTQSLFTSKDVAEFKNRIKCGAITAQKIFALDQSIIIKSNTNFSFFSCTFYASGKHKKIHITFAPGSSGLFANCIFHDIQIVPNDEILKGYCVEC